MIDTKLYLLYQLSNYHPKTVLQMDFMCPIVIKKTKAKMKKMSRDFLPMPLYTFFVPYSLYTAL